MPVAPHKITFYSRHKDKDGIHHTFPVDSESKHDTAKNWATVTPRDWDSENKKYVYGEVQEPIVHEFENKGFDNVTIVDLYHRGNGGRAYQVIVEVVGNKFRMDLREDTLMDVIEKTGIQAGGRLNGTFCFIKESAQTNIILEGTEIHTKAIAEREKREAHATNIKKSELKVGHLYETLSGEQHVFLGHIYSQSMNKYDELNKPAKSMLFLQTYSWGDYVSKFKEYIRTGENQGKTNYGVHIMKSHSFKIEKECVLENFNLSEHIGKINAIGQGLYEDRMNVPSMNSMHYTYGLYELAKCSINKADLGNNEEDLNLMKKKVEAYKNRYNYGRRW